jgi:prephenate dehydrogenase
VSAVVGVVGLGLIGGSLARDLAARGYRVLGADRDPATEQRARDAGVVSGPFDPALVDVVVLAVPVRAIPGRIRELADTLPEGAVVTDAGSTKRAAVEAAEAAGLGPRFLGSHPMAGDHRSGWDAARTGLFAGATVWTCGTRDTTPETRERIESLWRAVGAAPRAIDATEHDRLLARSSHLPQAVASALGVALARDGIGAERLGPGGRDTTRLAASDPDVWTDILADNHDEVEAALDGLIGVLTRFRRAIREADDAALRSLLATGQTWSRGAAEEAAAEARYR